MALFRAFSKIWPLQHGSFMIIYLEDLRCHWISHFTSPNARNFAWNFGGVYSSTRAIAWGIFPLPVRSSKPEVGYFAMKPTIFLYQIFPWVIKKWVRVDWITFRYRWNRKYWWKPEVFIKFNLWLQGLLLRCLTFLIFGSRCTRRTAL